MGLFDSLMQGDTGGMPDESQTGWQGLLNGGNPLLNIGLGILANNHGNYGSFGAAIGKGTQQGMANTQQYQQLVQQKQLQAMRMKQYQYEMDKQTKQDASDKAYGDSFNAAIQPPTNMANQSFQDANNNVMQGSDAVLMQGSIGGNLSPVDSSQSYSTNQTSAGGFDKSALLQSVMSNPNISADRKMALMQSMQKDKGKFSMDKGYVLNEDTGAATKIQDYVDHSSASGTPDIKNYEYAKEHGYKGTLTDYIQIKPMAMMPIATANLGINQQRLGIDQAQANYSLPQQSTAPQSYSVNAGGKTYSFKDQKSLNNFKLKAGVK